MNPVALYFASGESLYPGAILLVLAIAITPFLKERWQERARNITAWISMCVMAIASPPLSPLKEIIFLSIFLIWIFTWNKLAPSRISKVARTFAAIVLATMTLTLAANELSHRKVPVISGVQSDHLVVIGDSISAGIDARIPPWPAVFQQTTGIPVKNLALPGEQMNGAVFMARKVSQEDRVILIELGGSDLLAKVPADQFEHHLDVALTQLALPGRTLVMFELPLLPDRTAYGEIQRRLAAKFHVWLIPKRKFIEVIRMADATTDGIHLSPDGARRMARLVAEVLRPALTRP